MVIRKLCMASALAIFASSTIAETPLALKYREDAVAVMDNEDAIVVKNVKDESALNILDIDAQSIVRSDMNTQQALSVSNNIIKEFSSISNKNQKTTSKFIEHTKKDLIAMLKARKSELRSEIKSLDSTKTGNNVVALKVALEREQNRTDEMISFISNYKTNNKTELSRALLAYFSLYLAELRNSIMLQDAIEKAKDIDFYSKNTKLSEKALAVMDASGIVATNRFIKKFIKKGHAVFKDKAFNSDEVQDRLNEYLSNKYQHGILQSEISSEFIKDLVIGYVYADSYNDLTQEKQNAIPRMSTLLAENIILSLNKKSAKQKLAKFFGRDKQNSSQGNKVRKRDKIKNFFSKKSKNTDSKALVVRQNQDAVEEVNEPIVDLESQQHTMAYEKGPEAIEWVAPRGNVKAKRAAWEKLGMISNRNSETYYSILGVSQNASASEISKAYKKLARQYHPDKTGGDKVAEQKLKKFTEAYNVLKDPEQKSAYDRKLEYKQFENKYRH